MPTNKYKLFEAYDGFFVFLDVSFIDTVIAVSLPFVSSFATEHLDLDSVGSAKNAPCLDNAAKTKRKCDMTEKKTIQLRDLGWGDTIYPLMLPRACDHTLNSVLNRGNRN